MYANFELIVCIVSMTEDAKLLLFSAIVITNLLFVVYWLYFFMQEIKITIRTKYPILYKYLYLFGS